MNDKLRIVVLIIIVVALAFIGLRFFSWYQGHTALSQPDQWSKEWGAEKGGDVRFAYFAGGCFWCVEADFEKQEGVVEAVSGYMGGSEESPSYDDVASGNTSHRETVKVTYYPKEVSYGQLVLLLLAHTDPTDTSGTFYDQGHQYTTAVYYGTDNEKRIAEAVIADIDDEGIYENPIVTAVTPKSTFWVADDYHQNYYKTNTLKYKYYRNSSGRDDFIESHWNDDTYVRFWNKYADTSMENEWSSFKKPDKKELKEKLTDLEYEVTQEDGTERPFDNEYYDNKEEGIYVDILSGEPLFSSTHKYQSGTGWPSFVRPISADFLTLREDNTLLTPRVEVRSKYADNHIGHVFNDGPIVDGKRTKRWCMNSAALRFVSKSQMQEEGYGEYVYLFE